MSKVVDDRIVQMELENQQFEQRAKISLSTLDKLKNALDFSSSTRNLSELQNAGKNFSLASIADSVDSVSQRFSALGIMGMRVLERIADSAVDTGVKLAKSLSVDQMAAGWNKMEQKASSVQTIMNATGKSVEEVEGYLERLMWFSDETSYSFTDMTQSLAQLTSSGAEVEKVLPMITGIANSVAYAGKGAAEFSRAIYNLNQSYGHGSLQLIDWKSLELAGVASAQLKEEFIQIAEEMGKISKGSVTVANFSDTLKKGWADTEVMEKAFGKFSEFSEAVRKAVEDGTYSTTYEAIEALADSYDELAVKAFKSAQSAKTFTEAIDATKDAVSTQWEVAFETILGNYEQQVDFWSTVTEHLWTIFAEDMTEKNEFLKEWVEEFPDGREAVIQGFFNMLEALENSINRVKTFFAGLIPDITKERLTDITKRFEAFTEAVRDGEGPIRKWIDQFAGLQNIGIGLRNLLGKVGDIGKVFGSTLSTGFSDIFGGISAERLSKVTAAFAKFSVSQRDIFKGTGELTENGAKLQSAFSGITAVADLAKQAFTAFFEAIKPITGPLKDIGTTMLDAAAAAGEFLTKLSDNARESDFFTKAFEGVKNVLKVVVEEFEKFTGIDLHVPTWNELVDVFDRIQQKLGVAKDRFNELMDVLGIDFHVPTLEEFREGLDKILGIIPGMKKKLGEIGDALGIDFHLPTWNEFMNVIKKIKSVIESIGDFFDRAKEKIENFTGLDIHLPTWEEFIGFLERIKKIIDEVAPHFKAFGESIKNFLDKSLKFDAKKNPLKGFFDWLLDLWSKSGSVIEKLFDLIGKLFDTISEAVDDGSIEKLMETLLTGGIASFFISLSNALKGIPAVLDSVSKKLSVFGKKESTATDTLKGLSSALLILALIDGDKIAENIGAILAVLSAMVFVLSSVSKISGLNGEEGPLDKLFGYFTNNTKLFKQLSKSLVYVSLSLAILSNLDAESALVGAIALSAVMIVMSRVISYMAGIDKKATKAAKAMQKMSNAMLIASISVKILSTMSWDEALIGVISFGAVLLAMTTALNHANVDTTSLVTAGFAFEELGLAALMASGAVKILSTMNWKEALIGVISFGLVLGEMILAMNLLDTHGSIKSAASFLIMGLAVDAIAPAIRLLATMDWQNALVAVGSLVAVVTALTLAMNLLNGKGLKSASAFLVMAVAIDAITVPLLVLSQIPLWEEGSGLIPALIALAGALAVLGVAAKILSPMAVDMLKVAGAITVFSLGLDALGVGMLLVAAGFGSIGLSASLGATGFIAAFKTILDMLPEILVDIVALVADFLILLVEKIADQTGTLIVALLKIGNSILEVIRWLAGPLADTVLYVIAVLLEEIAVYTPTIINDLVAICEEIIDGVFDALPELLETAFRGLIRGLANSVLGLIDGALGFIPAVHDAMETAQDWISTAFASPVAEKTTKKYGEGLSKGLKESIPDVTSAFDGIKEISTGIFDDIGGLGEKTGNITMNGLIDSVKGKTAEFTDTTSLLSKAGLDGISEYFNEESMADIAQNGIDGFANVINKNVDVVKNSAKTFGSSFIGGMKSILQIASPSKATGKIATFTIQGFVDKLLDGGSDAEKAGTRFGERALEAIRKPLSTLAEAIDSGIDLSPRIRPVLDLSGIQNGGRQVQSVLGSMDYTMRTMSSISRNQQAASETINSKVPQTVTNVTNNYYDAKIDAKNVKEFNDLVSLSQRARRVKRMGGVTA